MHEIHNLITTSNSDINKNNIILQYSKIIGRRIIILWIQLLLSLRVACCVACVCCLLFLSLERHLREKSTQWSCVASAMLDVNHAA